MQHIDHRADHERATETEEAELKLCPFFYTVDFILSGDWLIELWAGWVKGHHTNPKGCIGGFGGVAVLVAVGCVGGVHGVVYVSDNHFPK